MFKTIKLLAGLSLLAMTSQVQAVAVDEGNCLLSDFTNSISCEGVFNPGNDGGVHDIFESTSIMTAYPGVWTMLTKLEDDNGWTDGSSLGLEITGQGTTSGNWWINNGWGGLETGDVLAVVKAGSEAAAFEVDIDSGVGIDFQGTWSTASASWDPSSTTSPAISHFSFWVQRGDVPEPGMIGLLAIGLLGMVAARRKMKA